MKQHKEKLLAEWFWTDRWMGSSAFLLPIDARGLYREMLTQSWRRGARLPADHEQIRRATGVTIEEWKRSWPTIAPYWHLSDDGLWLVNNTQLEVYAEAKAVQERATERASTAAKSRWRVQEQPSSSNAQASSQAPLEVCPPSPSPSPSLTLTTETTDNGLAPHTAAAPDEAPKPPKIEKPPPDLWSREACDDWISAMGGTAPGGQIGSNLKPLVKSFGWDEVRKVWQHYLASKSGEYSNAVDFAKRYGYWRANMNGIVRHGRDPTRQTISERNLASQSEFERKIRERMGQ